MTERRSTESILMDVAQLISKRSTCSRLQVGAVLARDGRIISTGYNGAPSGMPHCGHTSDFTCTISVHAEVNAIAYAARNGVATNDATLFTTHSPCRACAQLIINAGITTVYYDAGYRDPSGIELLSTAGVDVFTYLNDANEY